MSRVVRPGRPGRFGIPWLVLCLVLAVHVLDEALHDFLSVYNPAVLQLRTTVPWLPLPTFSFPAWIFSLSLAIVGLLALTPFAFRRLRWMRVVALIFSAVMVLNGLGHIAVTIYAQRPIAGVYSAPLVLVAAAYLWHKSWNSGSDSRSLEPFP